MLNILHCPCQTCFPNAIIPSMWNKSIIKPILKSANLTLEFHYTSISTLYTCKLYSGVFNNGLYYLEFHGVLVDEQNGLRKNRTCTDHIYAISSVVRAGLQVGIKQMFACFVALKRAFDWINRDLLEYK